MTTEQMMAVVEERWRLLWRAKAIKSSQLAVGLRFDVFNRDRFTCKYCGRTPESGAVLEADHIIPRSQGGLDVIDNLITACWECNSGKTDKALTQRTIPVL